MNDDDEDSIPSAYNPTPTETTESQASEGDTGLRRSGRLRTATEKLARQESQHLKRLRSAVGLVVSLATLLKISRLFTPLFTI